MSTIGIDFGNDACVIGLASKGGIDIILNESSNRRNPTMTSFSGKQRFMGEGALSISRSNYKNTVRDMKRLVGRKWGEPELMQDLERLSFETEKHPQTGGVGCRVEYDGKQILVTPEQVIAMMLTKITDVAKAANSGLAVVEAVLGIPGWYTDAMRRAMLDACHIASLNCLRLMHESTATALAYGIYRSAKGHFDDAKPQHVLFIDLGHSTFSASVVSFTKSALTVKSACYDRMLGGRDMDWAIAQNLADDFKAKFKLDARASKKSLIKLLDAAEKAKKTLSPVGVTEANVNIECLVDEKDYNGKLSLETFEGLIAPLVARMSAPIEQALSEAGVTRQELEAVEIVGGSTRVPAVKKHIATLLQTDQSLVNFGLSCTMNADEAVARGTALQCAMLSSKFRVKEFQVNEAVQYPVLVSWEPPAAEEQTTISKEDSVDESNGEGSSKASTAGQEIIFKRNDRTPLTRRLTIKHREPFSVKVAVADSSLLPQGVSPEIGTFKIDVPETAKAAPAPPSVRLHIKHDINGIVSVATAELMKEIIPEAKPAADTADTTATTDAAESKEAKDGMDVDSKSATGTAADGAASDETESANAASADSKEDGSAAAGNGTGEPAKKKFRAVPLSVQGATAAWSASELMKAVEEEASMAHQDRVVAETANKRNELETYIYSTRDRIAESGDLHPFASSAEATKLGDALRDAEDWLYSDEGFESAKSVYATKLSDLQTLGTPLDTRLWESQNRAGAASDLRAATEMYKKFANSQEESTAHITDEDKDKVRAHAVKAEEWLYDRQGKQSALSPATNPAFTVKETRAQMDELHKACRPIMMAPKPKPAPAAPVEEPAKPSAETPTGAAATPEPTPMDESDDTSATAGAKGEASDATAAEVSDAKSQPMEVDESK